MLSVTTKSGIYNGSKVIGTQTLGLRGLVLWLKFNEGSGNIAYDSSFYNNHGTIYGATWTDGKFGKALSFDGVDDYVEVARAGFPTFTNKVTLAGWVKLDSLTSKECLISLGDPVYQAWIWFPRFSIGVVEFGVYTDANYYVHTAQTVETDKWYHVALVYDSELANNNLKGYINGELWAQRDVTGNLRPSDSPIHIGKLGDGYLNGIVDEVRIYNRTLSENEIKMLYYNRIGAVPSKTI